jgi:hypothetical protein
MKFIIKSLIIIALFSTLSTRTMKRKTKDWNENCANNKYCANFEGSCKSNQGHKACNLRLTQNECSQSQVCVFESTHQPPCLDRCLVCCSVVAGICGVRTLADKNHHCK